VAALRIPARLWGSGELGCAAPLGDAARALPWQQQGTVEAARGGAARAGLLFVISADFSFFLASLLFLFIIFFAFSSSNPCGSSFPFQICR
jgi:hypothetical protein